MRELLAEGDRLISVAPAGSQGHYNYKAGANGVLSIGVRRLPGPMGFYLVANIIFEDDRPDIIVPLHAAEEFSVSNPN